MSPADLLPPGLRSPPLARAKDKLRLGRAVLRMVGNITTRALTEGERIAALNARRELERALDLIEEAERLYAEDKEWGV